MQPGSPCITPPPQAPPGAAARPCMGVQPPALPCTSLHTRVHSSPLHIKKTNFFFWKQHWKTLLSQSNFPLTYSEVSAPATRFPPHLSHVPLLLHHPISAGRTALFYKISSPRCAFPCPPSHHLNDRHQQHAVLPSHTLTCSDLPAPPCTNPCQAPRSGDGCGVTGEDRRVVQFPFKKESRCLPVPLHTLEFLRVCLPHLHLCCKHKSCTEPQACSSPTAL